MPMQPKPKSPRGEKVLIIVFCLVMALSLLCVAGVYLLKTHFLANHPDGAGTPSSGVATPAGVLAHAVMIDMGGLAALTP